ncbi:MAG TPA: carboxypeptidase-like regulatory domain-containing protein [Bryobacteraceae bacterium]|nr:carboxypeptidase-like regulatory domain-containing protein [Bryobacteraceae bacterium]
MRSLGILAILLTPHLAACATLEGEVQDPLGNGIPWARAELVLEGTEAGAVKHADKEGQFLFSWLPPGIYSLKLASTGFESFTLRSIQLKEGDWKRLPPLMLELGSSSCTFKPIVESYELLPQAQHVGNFSGSVKQMDNGPPVANTRITLVCNDGKKCGETKSDPSGEFIFFDLRPGEYGLRVTHFGYYPLEASEYVVREGFDQTYQPLTLEHCPNGNCDPRLRPKRPLIVCQ